jgi:hypothetical protein
MSFKQFKAFAESASTRCGLPFEMKAIQKNREGAVTAVKGFIFIKNENGEQVSHEMLWNLKGQAMLLGEQFDLVQEQSIEDLEDEDLATA